LRRRKEHFNVYVFFLECSKVGRFPNERLLIRRKAASSTSRRSAHFASTATKSFTTTYSSTSDDATELATDGTVLENLDEVRAQQGVVRGVLHEDGMPDAQQTSVAVLRNRGTLKISSPIHVG